MSPKKIVEAFFERNAIAFALNAIVGVRLRRRNKLFLIYRKMLELATTKIDQDVARNNIYISTGNDLTSYFISAANRANVSILGHVLVEVCR